MRSRLTKQKELLYGELEKISSFFDAEELNSRVAGVGLATTYRFLSSLVQEGKIHSFQCNRKTIYSTNSKNHSHFKCEQCGKVAHLGIKKIDPLQEEVKGKICHFQIDITGICEECVRKKEP